MPSSAVADSDTEPYYPPGIVPPQRPLGLARYFLRFVDNPLSVMPAPVYQELVYQVGRRITYVCDPALVKRVLLDEREKFEKSPTERATFGALLGKGLLTAEGQEWRWQRQTTAPQFRHADILKYAPAMSEAALALVEEWRADRSGRARRIDADMSRVTFRVISETMLHSDDPAIVAALERSNSDYLLPVSWPFAYGILGLPTSLPYPGRARRRAAERDMRAAVGALVAERRARPQKREDLFTRLLAARNSESGDGMRDEQMIDNLLTFLLAGHETTAKALSWALYLVARQPRWEERLFEEATKVAGEGPIEADHIERLVETRKFLKETMRLYPPISSIGRVPLESVDLGRFRVEAGRFVLVPIYAIHRHRKLWEDPDRFDPQRFCPEAEAAQVRYQYMPFGAGPRVCIGNAFALLEATIMLATFVRAARFESAPGYLPIPLSRITLQPKGGMALSVRLR